MKEQILEIAEKLKQNIITTNEAENLLLDLFGVSKSLPNDLDIEDFGYDSRAFELYKQGKHPLQMR
jgi:hypothetical protein